MKDLTDNLLSGTYELDIEFLRSCDETSYENVVSGEIGHAIGAEIAKKYMIKRERQNSLLFHCSVYVFSERELSELLRNYRYDIDMFRAEVRSLKYMLAELQKKVEVEK